MPDTYQQRRLDAALLSAGYAGTWRDWLLEQRRQRKSAAEIGALLAGMKVLVDSRTLLRWTRQITQEREEAAKQAGAARARDWRRRR